MVDKLTNNRIRLYGQGLEMNKDFKLVFEHESERKSP